MVPSLRFVEGKMVELGGCRNYEVIASFNFDLCARTFGRARQ